MLDQAALSVLCEVILEGRYGLSEQRNRLVDGHFLYDDALIWRTRFINIDPGIETMRE